MRCRGARVLRAGCLRAVEWICRAMLSGAWPVVHQTFSVTVALGGLLRVMQMPSKTPAPPLDATGARTIPA